MKVFKFLLSFIITLALVIVLSLRISSIPPLGTLLDPFHGFWQNVEDESDNFPLALTLDGLHGAVTIQYDSLRIPHIFAQHEEDLYMAQGYVTAADRLWQMEFVTYAAAGRLSEIIGARALDYDRLQRRKGMVSSAEEALKLMESDSIASKIVNAYARGVNAYIRQLDETTLPVEYKLLDYRPESWTPLKTSLLLKYMANDLTFSDVDLENTNTLKLLGKERFNFFFPTYASGYDPVVDKGTPWKFKPVAIDTPQVKIMGAPAPSGEKLLQANPANGSNNWAVSGSKTRSGKPILANDPHLGLNLPNIWYLVQMHGPGVNVFGASLPGAPNVIIGFNDSIAWGVTNARRDVKDWYKIDFANNEQTEYRFDNINLKTQKRIETIQVRDGDVFLDTVVYTHQGPVVYDQHYPADTVSNLHRGYALQWMAHEPSLEILTFYNLNRADNYRDYQEALKTYVCPAQNFAFAAANGDVALWVQGKFPAKWKGQGRFMMDGSQPKNDWQAFIPFEQNAHILNPARGFVSSANQVPADSTYPYYVYDYNFEHYRNRRINNRLSEMKKVTPEDMMVLQNDNYNLKAAEILPLMLDSLDVTQFDEPQQKVYDALRKWNFYNNATLPSPAYFDLWWDRLLDMMWDEMESTQTDLRRPDSEATIHVMKKFPNDPFMDRQQTTAIETMTDLIRTSFSEAVGAAQNWTKGHEQPLTWANFKSTHLSHLLRIEAFGRANIQTGGGPGIVNATGSQHGPSWRMVVALGTPPKAWGVYPGGQSGNPGSLYYDNMVERWSKGQYYEMLFLTSEDDKASKIKFTQRLYPPTRENP